MLMSKFDDVRDSYRPIVRTSPAFFVRDFGTLRMFVSPRGDMHTVSRQFWVQDQLHIQELDRQQTAGHPLS